MEYTVHQPLKTYSGGLCYLAGSFIRSVYKLGQNIVGACILWKYGIITRVAKAMKRLRYSSRKKSITSLSIQMIWAGKPYPMDYDVIASFDKIVNLCKYYRNCTILAGYELHLSQMLKQGGDVWLNTPRRTHEASGTSGMSAAMNGCINGSILDGWFPEFVVDDVNCFVIPNTEISEHKFQQDETDAHNRYNLLQKTVIPM